MENFYSGNFLSSKLESTPMPKTKPPRNPVKQKPVSTDKPLTAQQRAFVNVLLALSVRLCLLWLCAIQRDCQPRPG